MKQFIFKRWKYILTALVALFIGSSMGPSESEVETLENENKEQSSTIKSLKSTNKELQAKVDEAKPWFELSDIEKEQQLAAAKEAEEKRLAEEKAKAEAEAQAKAEAEAQAKAEAEEKERIGYNTGITYDQLARTPDDYIAQKVKFKGKVIQVMEGDKETQIRVAVNSNYDTVIFAAFDKDIVSSRVLEDDIVTLYGMSTGLLTYKSTMGGNISIPGMIVDKIE